MKRRLLLVGLVAACGGGGSGDDDDQGGVDAAAADAAVDAPGGCPRVAGPEDGPRFVVVAHPYDAAGGQASEWEVLELSAGGALTRPSPRRTFTMGRAPTGEIAFTPDGEVGLVAQEDGTVGVFTLDAGGVPQVVEAGFAAGFYASRVVVDPGGERAFVLDGNWRENGGGIYEVAIGCDGHLSARGRLASAKLAGQLALATSDRAVLAATDVLTSTAGDDVHLLAWSATPSVVDGVDAFGDDEAIVGGAALTSDGGAFLVGDTSQFSGVPNRVAVVGVEAAGLTAITVLSPVEDPQAIEASPFGDVAV